MNLKTRNMSIDTVLDAKSWKRIYTVSRMRFIRVVNGGPHPTQVSYSVGHGRHLG